jgi:hypothetical protein
MGLSDMRVDFCPPTVPSGHIRKSKISKSIPTLSLFIFCDIRTTAMAPPIINIEFMKDQIQQWYLTDCETIDTIIDRVFIEIPLFPLVR